MGTASFERGAVPKTLAIAVLGSIAVGVGVAALSPGTRTIALVTTGGVLALPVLRRALSGRFDPLEPIFISVLAYAVMFIVHPASTISSGDFVYRISAQGISIDETFDHMLVLGAAGAIGLVAGYETSLGQRLARRARAPRPGVEARSLLGVTVAFSATGIVLFAAFILMMAGASGLSLVLSGRSAQLTEAVTASTKYLYFGPLLLVPGAVVALAVALREHRRSMLLLSAALVLGVLVLRGPVGSRMTLLPLFGGLLTYAYVASGRRPGPVSIVVTLVLALTGSAFLLGIRNSTQREQTSVTGVLSGIAHDPRVVFDPLLGGQDAAEASGLAAAMTLVGRDLPHTYGRSMLSDVVLRPVPRSLWPSKPRPPRERAVAMLWPDLYASGTANPEFSSLFVFYLDGGIFGVLLGMFAYGLLLRVGYDYYKRHPDDITIRLVYAISLPVVVILLRDSLTDTVARWAFLVGPVLVAHLYARRAKR